jgi:peptidoglycan hydrolase-like protein with peptidoglycan-binding domain/outer membrane protein OmpA-like peptidoglycan-associated protein
VDDANDFTAGGGMTALHRAARALPMYVAPTDAADVNAIRIPLVPIACWRLNDPAFDFDSSFVLPSFRDELCKLADLVTANPGCPAALFGHADPVGSDALNKTISDRRATAVYALLTRDRDKWEDLYSSPVDGDKWGPRSIQWMLKTVPDGNGDPYYTGPVTGNYGPQTATAVRHFQGDSGLAVDGDAGPDTRQVLFGAYMDTLCTQNPPPPADGGATPSAPFHMQPADFLGNAADPGGKMALQGCSEFNPVLLLAKSVMAGDVKARNEANAPNRRVVIFLFRQGTKVDSGDWPCPRVGEPTDACNGQFWPDGDDRRQLGDDERAYKDTHDTMACRFYDRFARRSPCEGGTPVVVLVPLIVRIVVGGGDDAKPLPQRAYRLVIGATPDASDGLTLMGATDDQGFVRERVPPGATGGTLTILHDEEDGSQTEVWKIELEFADIGPADTVAGAQARLNNLGLFAGREDGQLDDQTKRAVHRFQMLEKLPIELDPDLGGETAVRLKDVHGS